MFILTLITGTIRNKNEKNKFNNNINISKDEEKTNIDKEQENFTNTNDFADRENIQFNEVISETQTTLCKRQKSQPKNFSQEVLKS